MLHLKGGLHAKVRALLDREGLVLEPLDGAGARQVDDDVGAAFDLPKEKKKRNVSRCRWNRIGLCWV